MRTSLLLSLATALLSSSLVLHSEAQQLCNGYEALCAKTYDKVAYATTHNAYAYTPPGGLATNQDNNIPTQLKDGIRGLMLDAYILNGVVELCHSSCKSTWQHGLWSKLFTSGELADAHRLSSTVSNYRQAT